MKLNNKTIAKRISKFDKSFKKFHQKNEKYYGSKFAERIKTDTLKFYKEILPITPHFKGRMNVGNFIINGNTLSVAYYKAMKANNKTVVDAVKIFYEINEELHKSIPKPIKWLLKKIFFSNLFLKFMQRPSAFDANHPESWKIEYKKGDGILSDFYFECKECGVIKYYKTCGVEELSKYCNSIDYIQSSILNLGMQNPKNIGQGDNICVEYLKKDRETKIPENLIEIVSKNQ